MGGTARPNDLSRHNRKRDPLRVVVKFFRQLGEPTTIVTRLQLTILTSLVILIANIGSGIVLARALGPTGRGIFTAATLFGPLIGSVGGLGIAEALVYQSRRLGTARSAGLVTGLWIGAAQSSILVFVGWVILPELLRGPARQAEPLALAYLAYIPLLFLTQYPLAILQGRLRLGEYNFVRASVHVIYTGALVVLWRVGAVSVGVAMAASLASAGVMSALAIAAAAKFSGRQPSLAVARELLGYGLRSHAGNLATIIVAQLDVLMLTAMVSSRDLGYYAVATSAAMAGGLIPTAASLVLFPTVANQPTEAAPRALARFLLWGCGGALVFTPILLLAVPWAVAPVYGHAFRAAAPVSAILVPGYLLRGTNQMLVAILRGLGTPMLASTGQIVGLVVLAALLPIGISARGADGAAVAVTVSAAAAFSWLLTTALRHGRLSPRQVTAVWRSDLASVVRALWKRDTLTQP